MHTAAIDERLQADCHCLGHLPSGVLLLNRNALLPWFILVPDTSRNDILDLPADQRDRIIADCAAVSAFIKRVLGFDKVNFAGLGNVVAQMHLHIIGRREADACWPQPVWGNLPEQHGDDGHYSAEQLRDIQAQIATAAGLVPASLE